MPEPRTRQKQADVSGPLARRLIAGQFPRWADLPMSAVRPAGTDNAIYRLGTELAVRLPRHRAAASALATEQRWLPRLAPLLPLAIPKPLAMGVPAAGFPFPWSVYRWLDGENAAGDDAADLPDAAVRLGQFVAALRRIDAAEGPPSFRGGPVSALDARVRGEIRDLGAEGVLDAGAAAAVWESATGAQAWQGPPVWVHADLFPVNMLTRRGRLAAVIDFGGLGTGDPAIDMLPAWAWLTPGTRELFRAHAGADDATWKRGRGWGLGLGVGAVHYYRGTNQVLAAIGQHAIRQALADYRHHGG